MRFVLLNQYAPPDRAPTGRALGDVARGLEARGHDVRVVHARGRYDEDGGRLLRAAGYAAKAASRLAFGPRADLVVALTTPPFIGVLAAAAAGLRGMRHAHWLMDLYPDALAAAGWLRPAAPAFGTLAFLVRRAHRASALVLCVGPAMAERAAAYGGPVEWAALWSDTPPADEADVQAARAERGWAPEETVLLWSGHLGRGHRLDDFLEAARRLGPHGPRWSFRGRGPGRARVDAFARANPEALVEVGETGASAAALAAGDVLLASVAPGWEGVIVPHKVQGAFGVGRPVLLVADDASESARWVRAAGGGWVVRPGDVEGVLAALGEARSAPERRKRGAAALAWSRAHFDRGQGVARVVALLEAAARR